MRKSFLWIAVACLALVFGCVETGTKKPGVARHLPQFGGEYTVDPAMEKDMPKTVAVLPFWDVSGSKQGSEIVRRGFYNHFSSLGFQDKEFFQTDRVLAMNGLLEPQKAYEADPAELCRLLGVDAVVKGKVSNFDKLFAVIYSQVAVGADVAMYGKDGTRLWEGKHTVRYHEGGIPTSLLGLAATIFSTSMNMRQIQLLRACDDLFRDMVTTIPAPDVMASRRPPVINLVVQDTQDKPKKAGSVITIMLTGEANMTAWADIGQYRTKIALDEKEPGVYVGTYTVMPGDNVADAPLIGFLSDPAGNTASYIDPVGFITLDTAPPATPSGLVGIGMDQEAVLRWNKNTEPDMAAYDIFASATPLTGYTPAGSTEFCLFSQKGLPNNVPRFFKVAARDLAGNQSKPAGPVSAMPVPPGPTVVSGLIDRDTVWAAGGSPYVLAGTVTVADTAVLTLQPGVSVVSDGHGLVVNGRLMAVGLSDTFIRFSAKNGSSWAGIAFADTGDRENALFFCRISGATAAVTCRSASPALSQCELLENGTGVDMAGAFSKPVISGCTIHGNRGDGIAVHEGASPAILGNDIQDNGGSGILVEIGSPAVTGNNIMGNGGSGIKALRGFSGVYRNNIRDNRGPDIAGPVDGTPVDAPGNFFGVTRIPEIIARLSGRVVLDTVLDAAVPNGKDLSLPLCKGELPQTIEKDLVCLAAYGPFAVKGKVTVAQGASLVIAPGSVLSYGPGAAIEVAGGSLSARGRIGAPIIFKSAGASPNPGAFDTAVRFLAASNETSLLSRCVIRHATVGVAVEQGAPEISHSLIADCSQAGIRAVNDASPAITYCAITRNQGSGGIEALGRANPGVHFCNIFGNSVNLQAMSSITLDVRNNWWGAAPPDESLIWGPNVSITPYLSEENQEAAQAGK
ncbi:MAG: right-handed parallel beta-helix repeat-containing protein [Thermodesulfobacteriota bacterium]